MVVTKKQVFWSKTSESHEAIIEEFGLKEKDVRGNVTFVRIEIVPLDNDYALPFSKWKYELDQDLLPKWYVAKDVERRARKHLKEWRKQKVIMPNEKRVVKEGDYILINCGTVQEVYSGGTVQKVYGGTVQEVYSGGTVITYIKLDKGILKSASAVLVDRSGVKVKCYVGKAKP